MKWAKKRDKKKRQKDGKIEGEKNEKIQNGQSWRKGEIAKILMIFIILLTYWSFCE